LRQLLTSSQTFVQPGSPRYTYFVMRRYLILIVVGVSLFAVSISGTIVTVAFPQIIADFDTTLIIAGWVLSIAQLTNTIAMPLAGKACDVFGRKTIFIWCTAIFTAGSLLSSLAPNVGLLIFFRFIQGAGAGGFLPAASAVIAEEFPERRQQYIGLFSTIFPIGGIIGPSLGGWLTEVWGWRSTFWVCIPLGLAILVLAIWFFRKTPAVKDSKLDLIGAGLISGSVTVILLAISLMGNTQGVIPWWEVALFLAIAAFLLVIFVRRLNTVESPIIDAQIMQGRPFIASNIFNFLYGVGTLGVFSYIPLYAVTVYGMSTINSGLITMPRSIAVILSSILVSVYLVRWKYRRPMVIGTSITAAALLALSVVSQGVNIEGWQLNGLMLVLVLLTLSGFSQGMVAPAANNACIELMPEKVGMITGVRGMFRQVGSAISINLTALVIHNSGDMVRGFVLVFAGLAVITAMTIPIIFFMPRGPESSPAAGRVMMGKL
jgi:EmrB/QacA subfamily drug resistance transporter